VGWVEAGTSWNNYRNTLGGSCYPFHVKSHEITIESQ
jgi:hypothetical protein